MNSLWSAGGPSHCLNPINVSNSKRVQGDCVWKGGETDSAVWPWFELVFTVHAACKSKTSRSSAILERSQCTLSLARRIWRRILLLRRTSPHPPLSNPLEGLRLPVSLSSSGFLFCCFVFVQMAYLRLDYLPLTGSRRSYYLYVCLCTTACARTCTRSLVSPPSSRRLVSARPFQSGDCNERGRGEEGWRREGWMHENGEWKGVFSAVRRCGGACFVALERTTLSFQTFRLGMFLQSVAV